MAVIGIPVADWNFSGGDWSLAVEVGIPVAWNLSSRFHNYFGIWISDFNNRPNVQSKQHPQDLL